MIEDQKRSPWIGVMETLDGWGYITAGFSFLVLGMIVFAHAWYMFIATFTVGVLSSVLALIHDLLLVVILLELFRIIASTRRILTTGAATAYTKDLTQEVFHQYLLDIGVNVLVIVALVFAVYMASKRTAPPLSP